DVIRKEFKNKYGYEIIIPNLLREIIRDDYKQNWENRLAHQIFNLHDFGVITKDLNELIRKKFKQ
ncbi:MAG: hypothetical protein P9M03_08965, partial [Candidatus Theseobacter exili]|nr:hypothetical protein [Candidatus Theseobacter exili]